MADQEYVSLPGNTCVICREPIRGSKIRAPCGHHYDISCLNDLFQNSIQDESLYPPRCCGQLVPITKVRRHLTPPLVTLFKQKQREFRTLHRLYCADPTCSYFLGPRGNILRPTHIPCPKSGCMTRTCSGCRTEVAAGTSHQCNREADQQLLSLSRDEGWARCPKCKRMIGLSGGCFHIYCPCKAQFCYICLATWGTCDCPRWGGQRLAVAARKCVNIEQDILEEYPARRNILQRIAEIIWRHR